MKLAQVLTLIVGLSFAVLISGTEIDSLSEKFKSLITNNLKNGQFTPKDLGDTILLDVIPLLLEQKPSNADGKFERNKEYLSEDTSNDEIARSSIEKIIIRSGFKLETHLVIADDGYISTLYNIINPRADPLKLKQPPVMVMHGGMINPTSYLWASAIQHHPEKYPRTAQDGPITSWNRSLAFTLANNGYNVWLVATRGSDKQSQGRIKIIGSSPSSNASTGGNLIKFESLEYWYFSLDELIQHEVPKQLDKILELTGASNVSLFTYSLSAMISLNLLGSRPDIAKNKIHNYISMAPILNQDSSNTFAKLVCEIILLMPVKLGTLLMTKLLSRVTRNTIVKLAKSRYVRYSLIKFLISVAFGSSGQYRTLLELPFLGHMLESLSFQELQHACQVLNAKRYQKYDYGAVRNKLVYGRIEPPAYDISNIHVKNWMLISGENDNLSPASAIEQILKEVNPKPLKHLSVPGSNHVDLLAAVDNHIQVNLPVLEFLDRFSY